jgi:hypothetical protein
MTITLFTMGIIAALAYAALRMRFLRIVLNMLPVLIGAGYAAQLILMGYVTSAVIVAIASLYATCPWWEFLDETIWMKKGVCRGF